MDEQIQSILDEAMTPQTPATPASSASDPQISSILDEAGVSQAPQETAQNESIPFSADSSPWDQFQQKASGIITSRQLPPAMLKVLLGQAAVESARGSAAPGNNFFGIKGTGSAGSNNMATQEYGSNGYYGENDNFGAYKTPEDSINAYLDLVLNYPGVSEAVKTNDPDAIIKAIEANGYATSPTYVQTVENTPEFNQ